MDEQSKAGLSLVVAVAETVKDLGQVPSGHLYAALMHQMTLDQYIKVVNIMKRAGMVKENNNLLTWVLGQ